MQAKEGHGLDGHQDLASWAHSGMPGKGLSTGKSQQSFEEEAKDPCKVLPLAHAWNATEESTRITTRRGPREAKDFNSLKIEAVSSMLMWAEARQHQASPGLQRKDKTTSLMMGLSRPSARRARHW